MSRSGYSDDSPDSQEEQWAMIRYQGQVASALRGKRGQAFLAELIESLDALPNKRLIEGDLRKDGEVCALGSIGERRAYNLEALDPEDPDTLANKFGIAVQVVREIEWQNDEGNIAETPEERWQHVRAWAVSKIAPPRASDAAGDGAG